MTPKFDKILSEIMVKPGAPVPNAPKGAIPPVLNNKPTTAKKLPPVIDPRTTLKPNTMKNVDDFIQTHHDELEGKHGRMAQLAAQGSNLASKIPGYKNTIKRAELAKKQFANNKREVVKKIGDKSIKDLERVNRDMKTYIASLNQ